MLRKKKGIGQKELATVLNLSVSTISNYENGIHDPDLETLCALSDYYGVTTDYLLGHTDQPYYDRRLEEYTSKKYTIKDLMRVLQRLPASNRQLFIEFMMSLEEILDEAPKSGNRSSDKKNNCDIL